MTARVYLMRGQGGFATSFGMDTLRGQIARLPGVVSAELLNWNQYAEHVNRIRARKKAGEAHKVVVGGFSLGANATTWTTYAVPGTTFDLAFCLDPSVYARIDPIERNVKRLVVVKNSNWLMIFGRADVPLKAGNTTTAKRLVETNELHLAVDKNPAHHRMLVDEITKVARA